SALERAIESKMPNSASAQQILDIARNPKNAVKKEELDWSGLPDFLEDKKGSISKQDVRGFLQQNKVELKEITKGGDNGPIGKLMWSDPYDQTSDGLRTWGTN